MDRNKRMVRFAGLAATALLLAASAQAKFAGEPIAQSHVYTMSNSPAGNSVLVFEQDEYGQLQQAGSFLTGGLGTGSGLGNQSALVHDGAFLFAVNAGSNEVSVLRFVEDGLELADVVYSNGDRPVSVTVDRGVLYVLNAGSDSIAGFTVGPEGTLDALPESVQDLSGIGTAAAQIAFSHDGQVLIVTERATNRVVSFALDRYGIPTQRHVVASPGETPFGFAVAPGRRIFVAEAFGGAAGASTVTSWKVSPHGVLETLTPAEPTFQSAACWVAMTPNGRFIYTTNTASNNISAFRVRGGKLDLISNGIAGEAGDGSRPIDVVITPDNQFLHTLNSGTDSIGSFVIEADGTLGWVGEYVGLPDGANGLAVR